MDGDREDSPVHGRSVATWKLFLFRVVAFVIVVVSPEVILRSTDLDRRLFHSAFEDPFEKDQEGWWRLLTYDPVLGWKGRARGRLPGSDQFLNERGFRGSDFATEKPPGMRRVVCLGDSATFGLVTVGPLYFTYEPTYSGELERLLNRDAQIKRFQVINAGVIGYSTWQGLRLLKHQVRYWQPDVITIRFGINDQWIEKKIPGPSEPRSALLRWSLDQLLDLRTYQLIVRLKAEQQRAAGTDALPARPRVALPDFENNLQQLVINARAAGAHVVLLTAPLAPLSPEITANTSFLEKTGYPTYAAIVDEHLRYDDTVRRVAADLNVPLVDSSKDLAARGLESFFSRYDLVHPDGRGHLAIAEELEPMIPIDSSK